MANNDISNIKKLSIKSLIRSDLPLGIKLIAVLQLLFGFGLIFSLLGMLLGSDSGRPLMDLLFIIIVIIFGVVLMNSCYGLLKLKKWAYLLTIVTYGFQLIYSAISLITTPRYIQIFEPPPMFISRRLVCSGFWLILTLVILVYFSSTGIRKYYGLVKDKSSNDFA